jgi:uncharacterized phage-associated protein
MDAMFERDAQMMEAFAYIAASGLKRKNMYNLLKVFYHADKAHMEKYGRFIFDDTYIAERMGPVPSRAWDLAKMIRDGRSLPSGIDAAISISRSHEISVLRDFDEDYFSESDIECIEDAIALSKTTDLGQESHDAAWEECRKNNINNMTQEGIISILPSAQELQSLVANRY